MPIIGSNILAGAGGQSTGVNMGEYDGKSLILDNGSSEFLSRTFGNANGDTWTFSCWVKRVALGTNQTIFGRQSTNAAIVFDSNDKLQVNDDGAAAYTTTAVFRDTSKWYHILFTGNGTLNKVYVNSVLQTLSGAPNIGDINTNAEHRIGHNAAYGYGDFYLADVHFVDGTELAASSFGETSADTGAWVMKPYTGSHGDNGFQLDFQKSGGIERGGETEFTLTSGTVLQRTAANDSSAYFEHVLTGNFRFDWRAGSTSHGAGDGQKIGIIPATQRASWNHATGNGGSGTNWYVNFGSSGSSDGQAFEDGSAESHTAVTYSTSTVFSLRRESGSTIKLYVDGSVSHTYGTTSSADMVFFYGSGDKSNTGTITNFSIEDDGTGTSGDFYTLGLGNDVSGNNNDWEIEEGASQSNDTPVDNYATWSNLHKYGGSGSAAIEGLFNGDTKWQGPNGGGQNIGVSSFSVDASEDTFVEFKVDAVGNTATSIGILPEGETKIFQYSQPSLYSGGGATGAHCYIADGDKSLAGATNASYGDSYTTGDIIGMRLNNGSLFFYKNGTIQNSGTAATTGITGKWLFACSGENGFDCTVRVSSLDWGHTPSGVTSENQFSTGSLPDPDIGTTDTTRGNDYVNAVLYTGNGTAIGSGGKAVTGVGFAPDFVTIRARDGSGQNWMNFDSVRGVTKRLFNDGDGAEATDSETLTAFGSDGFTVGNHGNVNTNTTNYVSYNWLAGTAFTNNSGTNSATITTTGEHNADSKFAVFTYTGNNTDNAKIYHPLGVVPDVIIVKRRDDAGGWFVYHSANTSAPETEYLRLNLSDATTDSDATWSDDAPTSTLITLKDNDACNGSSATYVAYCWANGDSFASGGYEGNGDANGARIYCPFRPQIVITKRTDSSDNWRLIDTARSTFNDASTAGLKLNETDTESDAGNRNIDFLSNGFKIRDTDVDTNASSGDYIWMAWAHTPFKFGNAF